MKSDLSSFAALAPAYPELLLAIGAVVLLLAGVIFSAAYALFLYRRVVFGALTKDSLKGILDLDAREITVLVPLIVLTILFGFYPAPILDATAASVNLIAENFSKAISSGAALVASAN